MEDIIACGWDAKHSFEDVIEPVWQIKERYGDRITLLGGFDMADCRIETSRDCCEHTRLLDEFAPLEGAGAWGRANTVANYVPIENLLARGTGELRGDVSGRRLFGANPVVDGTVNFTMAARITSSVWQRRVGHGGLANGA